MFFLKLFLLKKLAFVNRDSCNLNIFLIPHIQDNENVFCLLVVQHVDFNVKTGFITSTCRKYCALNAVKTSVCAETHQW